MKITKVYTKTGDKGTTSLVGGIRINKNPKTVSAADGIRNRQYNKLE